ncbi:hypothetical protein CSB45_05705 [candidate division KSB3 bacterium]|uniref:Carbohydrate kinase PfkB domain-containing protein n=1 Tax=candidate division KSB3 bacterium TaxID=2044937 RepID=A0A2G6E6Q5_9BACT|nr:MAG: hypothetical protein CSB45_05705 [candidate division KSB3 bacterium]PIE30149.1 MAG: hypothetical protein CSA57_04415 [candidate division KSB3 bacterium]
MVEIVCLGEVLIDFVSLESGVSLVEAPSFKKAAGGAPANVAVGLARLGHSVGFIGKVGQESFGDFLIKTLADNQVDVSGIARDPNARTMLAFVSLAADGEREFMFYRHPSADMTLTPEEIPDDLIANARLFHYGSISLISEPCRSATLHALTIAKENGVLTSYDPNLRLNLWESEDMARREMLEGMRFADVVKINEDELHFLTGSRTFEEGAKALMQYGVSLLIVTMGEKGCCFYSDSAQGMVPGKVVQAVDTTGAGDSFVAALLSGLLGRNTLDRPFTDQDASTLEEICRYANAAGALTSLERGAIPSLPTGKQIQAFLERS